MDSRALFLVKVAAGRQGAVLEAALGLGGVRAGALAGRRELLLLADSDDPGALGSAARALAEVEGVEAVDCSLVLRPRAGAAGGGNYL